MAEVADMLGVSRQAVHKWCRRAGINPTYARQRWLARQDARALYDNRGPPSKDTLRKLGHQAEAQWRARRLGKESEKDGSMAD